MLRLFKSKKRRPEARRAPRTKVALGARITYAARRVDCSTVDMSATGARLAVSITHPLPSDFDVRLSSGTILRARVVWRGEKTLGVRFV